MNEILEEMEFLISKYIRYPYDLLETANSHAELYNEEFMLMIPTRAKKLNNEESLAQYNSRILKYFMKIIISTAAYKMENADVLECFKLCTLQLQVLLEYHNLVQFLSKDEMDVFFPFIRGEKPKIYLKDQIQHFMACEEWAISYIKELATAFSFTFHKCYPNNTLKNNIEHI